MRGLSNDSQKAPNRKFLLGYMEKSAKHLTSVAGFFCFETTKMGD